MTTGDINVASEPVIAEIGVQINLLDQEGCAYVRSYFAHVLTGTSRPDRPAGMHPDIARAVRDLVLDEATAIRMHGPSRRAA